MNEKDIYRFMKWINRYIPFYEMDKKDLYRFMKFTIEKVVHYKIFAGEPKNNKNKLTINARTIASTQ